MGVIGLIPAFEEEENIGPAVRSLYDAGCERVVVLDGAYCEPVKGLGAFLGGACASSDETGVEAREAGAEFIVPDKQPRFGEKRELLLRLSRAQEGDHVFFLDADERAIGRLPDELPASHCHVILRNLKPNDLPDMRGTFPRGDYGPEVPVMRILRWSPTLFFTGHPGVFAENGNLIRPYRKGKPALPVLDGIEIHHVAIAPPERVEEKRRFYALK